MKSKTETDPLKLLKNNLIGIILSQRVKELQENCGSLCDCVTCMKAKEKHVAWCACKKCNAERKGKGIAEVEH
tara:strand:- start:5 stop:223 length:219 start_codon:yes stop_codon:yes gene_type:complete